jgi:hypothetical protein
MQSEQGSAPTSPDAAAQAPVSGEALARRRLLLKGLGKGASAAAVLVPIQTLATTTPSDGVVRLCTVSGIQSNVGSGRTGGTTAQCQGHSPSFYATLANWPGYNATTKVASFWLRSTKFYNTSTFKAVFNNTGASSVTLFNIISSGPVSEQIWVTALLNAIKRNGGTNIGSPGYFPYSPNEVVALYNDTAKRSNAETLFANYLQTLG